MPRETKTSPGKRQRAARAKRTYRETEQAISQSYPRFKVEVHKVGRDEFVVVEVLVEHFKTKQGQGGSYQRVCMERLPTLGEVRAGRR